MKAIRARTRKQRAFDPGAFLAKSGLGREVIELEKRKTIFSQGDTTDAVIYIQKGKIKLTLVSKRGKEATKALLGSGDVVGEECIAASQPQPPTTAAALTQCTILTISRKE